MKKALKILIGVVVVIAIVLAVAWFYIDSIAKAAVERGATYALGVDTRVDSMSLSLLKGTLRMDGLIVSNPAGFKTPHLMKSGRFDVAIVLSSLMKDTVEISRFELDGLNMSIEQRLGAGTNVSVILNNVKTPGGAGKEEEKAKAEGGRKVKIDRIVIRNVVAHIQVLPLGGKASTLDVRVPEIIMNGVTSDNTQGIAVSELVRRLLPAILAAVVEKGKGILPDGDLKELSGDVAAATQAVGQGAAKLVEKIGGDAGKQLEGLFKRPGEGGDKPGLLDALKKAPEDKADDAGKKKDPIGGALEGLLKKK